MSCIQCKKNNQICIVITFLKQGVGGTFAALASIFSLLGKSVYARVLNLKEVGNTFGFSKKCCVMQMTFWLNEKSWKHEPKQVFPQLFWLLPAFHKCYNTLWNPTIFHISISFNQHASGTLFIFTMTLYKFYFYPSSFWGGCKWRYDNTWLRMLP